MLDVHFLAALPSLMTACFDKMKELQYEVRGSRKGNYKNTTFHLIIRNRFLDIQLCCVVFKNKIMIKKINLC